MDTKIVIIKYKILNCCNKIFKYSFKIFLKKLYHQNAVYHYWYTYLGLRNPSICDVSDSEKYDLKKSESDRED